MSLTRIFSGI
jgi:hypothetical protein